VDSRSRDLQFAQFLHPKERVPILDPDIMAPVPPLLQDDFYVPPEFHNTPPIIKMHNIPRVTGQTEATVLSGGTPQEQSEYLKG
jgi:hypothetical protein